ncbi:MAG: Nif11-like leader peptide family natural product precursor [Oscillospiraceae bacterium]|nr:Nif11-like leader peptide family natural product precursor [Oscillospiraceae bacterium]
MQEKMEKVAALLRDEAFRRALSGSSGNEEVLALFRQFGVDVTGEELVLILQGGIGLHNVDTEDELNEDELEMVSGGVGAGPTWSDFKKALETIIG